MTLLWLAMFGGFVFRLIRRHGWEYVPLVVAAYGARIYDLGVGQGELWDGLALTTVAVVWFITRRDPMAGATESVAL